ncbi:hypothetical protein [Erwinia billingiae]|uniref:hypothetical protein n=1 Tax=Erwinia billingiae TaxID=182337 RepID=UPI0011AFEE39|nr:hypothetical protein [Erwinia billingiae]
MQQSIDDAKAEELEKLKDQLADEMGLPFGLHTLGIPAVASFSGMILSFAMPQFAIWSFIINWFSLPLHWVLGCVFFAGILFCGVGAATLFLIGKGNMAALKMHVGMVLSTQLFAIGYLLCALLAQANINILPETGLISAILGVIFIALSNITLCSQAFYKMLLFSLHNRALRKQLTSRQCKEKGWD